MNNLLLFSIFVAIWLGGFTLILAIAKRFEQAREIGSNKPLYKGFVADDPCVVMPSIIWPVTLVLIPVLLSGTVAYYIGLKLGTYIGDKITGFIARRREEYIP